MKLSDVNVGNTVQVDAGFTCIEDFATRIVHEDDHGKYITCADGKHYLNGQLNVDDELSGIKRPGDEWPKPEKPAGWPESVADVQLLALDLRLLGRPEANQAADIVEHLYPAMANIARGRPDNGRPIGSENARQAARRALNLAGLSWVKSDD